jgi:hypothetical protein
VRIFFDSLAIDLLLESADLKSILIAHKLIAIGDSDVVVQYLSVVMHIESIGKLLYHNSFEEAFCASIIWYGQNIADFCKETWKFVFLDMPKRTNCWIFSFCTCVASFALPDFIMSLMSAFENDVDLEKSFWRVWVVLCLF